MKMQKKILALAMALCLVLASLAGCSGQDTSWIAQSGEDTVPVGVYILEMMMSYFDAYGQLNAPDDLLKESIGETPVVQYISDQAKNECAKLLAVRKEFADRGLVLSDAETQESTYNTEYDYGINETYYKGNGVAKESLQYLYDTSIMSRVIFGSIYGEGGEKEIPRAELEQEFSKSFTRSQFVFIPKIDMLTGTPLEGEQLTAAKERADDFLARAKAGEELSVLYNEVMAELYPDGGNQELADTYLENNAGYFYPGYESAVVAAADNEIRLVEEEDVYFLIKKLPLLDGDSDIIDGYLSNIRQMMKSDEYMETLDQWGQNIDIRFNNAALAAYTPSKLKMTQEQLAAAAENDGTEGASGEDAADSADAGQSPEGSQPAEGPDQG